MADGILVRGSSRTGRRRTLVALAVLALLALAFAARADAVDFTRCPEGDYGPGRYPVRCATVEVPLDRSGAVAGTVRLHVERVAARSSSRPPLLVLGGGPGESLSFATPYVASLLSPALATRDVVVLDQRGTGVSGALRCWPFASVDVRTSYEAAEVVRACAETLGPRRAFYATPDSVEDIEAVRAALGVPRLAIVAVSYGTKVAVDYARAYPDRVERLVLDSVVPPDGVDPLARSTFSSLPAVLRVACRGACRFTEDPVADLARLVDLIERRGPLTRSGDDGGSGRLGRVDLFWLLQAGDFFPEVRAAFPAAVVLALRGDARALFALRARTGDFPLLPARYFSSALFAATICADTRWPWSPGASAGDRAAAVAQAAAAVPDAVFHPFDRTTALADPVLRLCRHWPLAPDPRGFVEADVPDVPALVLAGETDLRTPVADAAAVAGSLPRGRLVVAPWTGHAVLTRERPCVRRALARFLAGREPGACARGANPFPALTPARLTRVLELRPRPGR